MKTMLATLALGAAILTTPAFAQHGGSRGWGQRDMSRAQAQQMADMLFQRLDLNHDGTVTRQEAEQAAAAFTGDAGQGTGRAEHMIDRLFGDAQSVTQAQAEAQALARFDRDDLNHDGIVTAAEREQARAARQAARGGASR